MSQNEYTDAMGDVSHTNPYTGKTAGQLFSRGPIVAADGGEPAATPSESTDEEETADGNEQTMKDVTHTPPQHADDANRVFERGRNPTVEDEE